jgi:hypothetical protein
MDVAKPSHPMWGGAEFSPSLSGVCQFLRWQVLPCWRRFESLGVIYHLHVGKGKTPFART